MFLVHLKGFTADAGIFCVLLAEEGEVKDSVDLRSVPENMKWRFVEALECWGVRQDY